jgi:hypothetical protein
MFAGMRAQEGAIRALTTPVQFHSLIDINPIFGAISSHYYRN